MILFILIYTENIAALQNCMNWMWKMLSLHKLIDWKLSGTEVRDGKNNSPKNLSLATFYTNPLLPLKKYSQGNFISNKSDCCSHFQQDFTGGKNWSFPSLTNTVFRWVPLNTIKGAIFDFFANFFFIAWNSTFSLHFAWKKMAWYPFSFFSLVVDAFSIWPICRLSFSNTWKCFAYPPYNK